MVTARAIIADVERRGVRFEVIGDRLRAMPKTAITPELSETIGALKPQIIDELRKRQALMVAAALLRQGRWPPTSAVCDFHCGKPETICRRCGASWLEHYPSAAE